MSATSERDAKDKRVGLARKLRVFCRLEALAAFLLLHTVVVVVLGNGSDAATRWLTRVLAAPSFVAGEILVLWLPLAIYVGSLAAGIVRGSELRPPHTVLALEIGSGVAALLFLSYYATEFRVPLALGELRELDLLQESYARLSSTTERGIPLFGAFYLLGVAGTIFHFSYGLHRHRADFGTGSSAARRTRVAAVLGVVLFAISAEFVVRGATGLRFFLGSGA